MAGRCSYLVPEGVREHFRDGLESAGTTREAVVEMFAEYAEVSELADQLHRMQRRELPVAGRRICPRSGGRKGCGTRESIRKSTECTGANIPAHRGSADLATSNKTN